MTHEELCEATARKYVQTFALWEVKGKWENPDVITWNSSGRSTIYEIKMSRSDFLADFKKECRKADHKKAGCRFYYVCYGDFIKKEEIPENWGLIYYINNKFKVVKYPPYDFENWDKPDRDYQGEIVMLVNYILCNRFFNQQRYCFNKRYKANEWHYVKDGDLPKVNELVLIKLTGCFVLGWTNGTNWFNDSNNGTIIDRRMVIAWKEIVLPDIKESK